MLRNNVNRRTTPRSNRPNPSDQTERDTSNANAVLSVYNDCVVGCKQELDLCEMKNDQADRAAFPQERDAWSAELEESSEWVGRSDDPGTRAEPNVVRFRDVRSRSPVHRLGSRLRLFLLAFLHDHRHPFHRRWACRDCRTGHGGGSSVWSRRSSPGDRDRCY
mgnify:CR=1 FL=1